MRFFSGARGGSGGSGKQRASAGEMFKRQQASKGKPQVQKTPQEKYKDMLEARMAKIAEEAAAGRKGFKLPGTKQDNKPKALTPRAKQMMRLLAEKKAKEEQKKHKKKLAEMARIARAKKRAAEAAIKKEKDRIAALKAAQTGSWW